MDLKLLKEPFKPEDIEWRVQRSGITKGKPWAFVLAYVTNRAIMDRLDEVCGPENWENKYKDAPGGGILCGISIKVPSSQPIIRDNEDKTTDHYYHEWITKYDGAEQTNIEAVKGGLSSAMKRAAVQWAIGRYLYHLEAEFAIFNTNGKYSAKIDENWYKWDPPALPEWAVPKGTKQEDPPPARDMTDVEKSMACWSKIKGTSRSHLSRSHLSGLNRTEKTIVMKSHDFDKDKIDAMCDREIKDLENVVQDGG